MAKKVKSIKKNGTNPTKGGTEGVCKPLIMPSGELMSYVTKKIPVVAVKELQPSYFRGNLVIGHVYHHHPASGIWLGSIVVPKDGWGSYIFSPVTDFKDDERKELVKELVITVGGVLTDKPSPYTK